MKITRHTAKDMRQALRLVRDQLGPDAVILTSKRTPYGVEVTAAIDFDAARIEAQAPSAQPRTFRPEEFTPPAPVQQPATPRREDPYTIADSYAEAEEDVQLSFQARLQAEMRESPPAAARTAVASKAGATNARSRNSDVKAVPSPAPARAVEERGSSVREVGARRHSSATVDRDPDSDFDAERSAAPSWPAGTSAVARQPRAARNAAVDDEVHSALESAIDSSLAADAVEDDEALISAALASANRAPAGSTEEDGRVGAMSAELKAMRRILETQMAQLAWNDLTRRAPIHTEILTELTEIGLTQELAAQIVAQLPSGTDITKARRLSIALTSQRINVTGDRWLDKGGKVALIGPTGVGKTTALAKLAVRWVLRHGARNVALISADSIRIGAHDQMQALGQMLDVPVYIAESFTEIPKLLDELGQQRLVLIDTPGMSQRDAQLSTRMEQLAAAGHGLETTLVLSASTQAGAIEETVKRYARANPASALLTKVDEAASLGGILSALAHSELPISYVSEGQRVPEDLRPARALELVSRAVQLAKATGATADEDLLRRRYGDVAHALA
jgi:flagellar biosynthesis protein FlhF